MRMNLIIVITSGMIVGYIKFIEWINKEN